MTATYVLLATDQEPRAIFTVSTDGTLTIKGDGFSANITAEYWLTTLAPLVPDITREVARAYRGIGKVRGPVVQVDVPEPEAEEPEADGEINLEKEVKAIMAEVTNDLRREISELRRTFEVTVRLLAKRSIA